MILTNLPLQLMNLEFQLIVLRLCLFVLLERAGSLGVNWLMKLQCLLLLHLLPRQSLLLRRQFLHLPPQKHDLILFVLDLIILMLSEAGLDGLDLLLEPSDHPQLFLLLVPKLLLDLLRHLAILEFIIHIFLYDSIDDLLQFKHLPYQFFILLDKSVSTTVGHPDLLADLYFQSRILH